MEILISGLYSTSQVEKHEFRRPVGRLTTTDVYRDFIKARNTDREGAFKGSENERLSTGLDV